MTNERFFIRDCMGTIVGNPAGYRTMRGATAQYNNRRSKAHKAVWDAYNTRSAVYEATCMPIPMRRRNIANISSNLS